MWFYGCLFGAAARCYAAGCLSRALRLQTCIAPVSAIALDQMQLSPTNRAGSSVSNNYKQVKKDELAVCKDTRSNLNRALCHSPA